MTEPTFIALIMAFFTALPPTLVALAGFHQGKAIGKKADQIHELTNSNLKNVKAELALANKRISELEDLVATLVPRREI